jgi:hypothetical protein
LAAANFPNNSFLKIRSRAMIPIAMTVDVDSPLSMTPTNAGVSPSALIRRAKARKEKNAPLVGATHWKGSIRKRK